MTRFVPPSDFRVLLVDDDVAMLKGLERALKTWSTTVAIGPGEALETLRDMGPFDCIVSDLHMPGMNGITLMGHVRKYFPNTIRLVLTGAPKLPEVVHAVNDGLVFRFLLKPCEPVELNRTLEQAVNQRSLLIAEKERVEVNWNGSLAALQELLTMVDPFAIARGERTARLVEIWLTLMRTDGARPATQACKLAQLGSIGTIRHVSERAERFLEDGFDPDHAAQFEIPTRAANVLRHIPGSESMCELLTSVSQRPGNSSVEACTIRLALEIDWYVSKGHDVLRALELIEAREPHYPSDLMKAARFHADELTLAERSLFLSDVQEGMIFVTDVFAPQGLLLAARGQKVTEGLAERIRFVWTDFASTVKVRVQGSGVPS